MSEDVDTTPERLASLLRATQAREEALGREGFAVLPADLQRRLSAQQTRCAPRAPEVASSRAEAVSALREYHALLDEAFVLVRQQRAEASRIRRRKSRRRWRWAIRAAGLGAVATATTVYLRYALAEEAKRCLVSRDCVEHGRCGAALRFTGVPGIGCAPREDRDCLHSRACRRRGACALMDGVFAAGADADCRALDACRKQGRCAAVGGACRARDREDCVASRDCHENGACTPVDGMCIAATAGDCTNATTCRERGACTAVAGRCVVPDEGFAAPTPTSATSVSREARPSP
ncbi:MAG: hypothetical protein AAGN82_21590 [Myxococcota bacterium]